jgi:hypothetical protein
MRLNTSGPKNTDSVYLSLMEGAEELEAEKEEWK